MPKHDAEAPTAEVPDRTAEGESRALVCILIEYQSDTDPLMPLRMLYFAVGYWDRQSDLVCEIPVVAKVSAIRYR